MPPVWRKPSFAKQALTRDEALVADTLRGSGGLTHAGTRAADLLAAQRDHESSSSLWWTEGGGAGYDEALAVMVAEARRYREHGCPRAWPVKLRRFWYWVARRQQHEEA